ncbi:MAG: excinuclease ABC subunit C [Candidatus Doudnabacteria bacterium]|nr:excinuclease ABC subunit C [Candidatus Doudnabacteria bacterium]
MAQMTIKAQFAEQKDNSSQQRVVLLKQETTHFPHQPGCYLFKDATGVVLYVGKAKDLRKRTSQYFGHDKRPQLPFLLEDAHSIDYIVAHSELEALFLENTLIKKHNPKYNIKLKDDKNYAFIVINYATSIPQIGYVRKIADDAEFTAFVNPSAGWGSKAREHGRGYRLQTNAKKKSISLLQPLTSHLKPNSYFGPYSSVKKIRETLDFVRRIFPYCANTEVVGRPCFYYHLHRCPGVCVGAISLQDYQNTLQRIALFLNGKTGDIKKELKLSMQQAATGKRFELAARLRDQLRALDLLDERQIAQFASKVNYDLISLAHHGHLYCVNLFKVREGKLTDKENFTYTIHPHSQESVDEQTATHTHESNTIQTFMGTYYAEATDLPDQIFIQHPLTELSLVESLLRSRRNKKVPVTLPHRGKAVQLLKLGETNAQEHLRKQLETDATDTDKIHAALEKLQKLLKLEKLPRRIECYDMSNTQGTNPVGSMVVFVDGKPAKSEYRKFKIRSKETPDDFAMMRETLARRLARISNAQLPISNASVQSWPTPDLIVIDGGKGQLSAAMEAQGEVLNAKYEMQNENTNALHSALSIQHSTFLPVPMIGLAKRIEEIFTPNNPKPIILSHDEPALQLLQRLRDEAHRFGITFHRSLRSKQAVKSALDTIPGIGPKTKKLLKQKFGTLSNIKAATTEELEHAVGKAKAEIILKHL